MHAPFNSDIIKYFEKNMIGNDYVIGDIHGRYDLVEQALRDVSFDISCDRLFCVGDLINRGSESKCVIEFLQKPYVHAIRGNHEDMLLNLYAENKIPTVEQLKEYAENIGLGWWLNLSSQEQAQILTLLKDLPLIAEIQTDQKNVGLVHGDIHTSLDWNTFKELVLEEHPRVIAEALWGRTRLSYGIEEEVKGIGRVYVGHTVQPKIRKLANVIAIDTGAVFNEHLTIVNILCKTKEILKAKRPFGKVQSISCHEKNTLSIGGCLRYFNFLI